MSLVFDDDDEPAEGSRFRWAAIAGGVLVLVAVGGLAWLATDVPDEPGRVSALQQAVRLPAVWAATEPAAPVMPVAPVAIPASAPAAVPPGYLDVCGIGLVKASEWDRPARVEAMSEALERTRATVAAALRARPDEASRAMGLALEFQGGPMARDQVMDCEGADCPQPPLRTESPEARTARMKANGAALDQLARLAVGTRNSQVYGLAYRNCRLFGEMAAGATCGMLSADQWARLDPGNGHVWLEVAFAARNRGDRAAEAEAIHRAGLATSFDSQFGHFTGLMLSQLPEGVSELDAYGLAALAVNAEGSAMHGSSSAGSACTAAAVRDTNRLQQCSAVADAMWRHATDLMQMTVAQSLGRRVGWPSERLDARRDERDVVQRALMKAHESGTSRLSCAALKQQRAQMVSVGRLGEVGAARALVAASDKPLVVLTQEARAWRAAMAGATSEAAAAQAASAVPLAR